MVSHLRGASDEKSGIEVALVSQEPDFVYARREEEERLRMG